MTPRGRPRRRRAARPAPSGAPRRLAGARFYGTIYESLFYYRTTRFARRKRINEPPELSKESLVQILFLIFSLTSEKNGPECLHKQTNGGRGQTIKRDEQAATNMDLIRSLRMQPPGPGARGASPLVPFYFTR